MLVYNFICHKFIISLFIWSDFMKQPFSLVVIVSVSTCCILLDSEIGIVFFMNDELTSSFLVRFILSLIDNF